MTKKSFFFLSLFFLSKLSIAQLLNPMDRRHEIGVFIGGNNYIGDVGRRIYVYPNSYALGAIYKLAISKRHLIRINATFAHIFAKDAEASELSRRQRNLSINNDIYELGLGWEFNFFDFFPDRTKSHTFYTFAGIAGFLYSKQINTDLTRNENLAFSIAIPFGIGYKYKFSERFIIAGESGFRYTFTDNIDNSSPKLASQVFGNENNNDWYALTGISLTYTFGRAPCYCSKKKVNRKKKKKFFLF